jgi:hypothetical protein
MSSSAKPRSRRGTSGQEDKTPSNEDQLLSPQENLEKSIILESKDEAVQAVEDSGELKAPLAPPEDLRLAIKMNKHISRVLGLNQKSRSVVL